jgi:hypothetical protein
VRIDQLTRHFRRSGLVASDRLALYAPGIFPPGGDPGTIALLGTGPTISGGQLVPAGFPTPDGRPAIELQPAPGGGPLELNGTFREAAQAGNRVVTLELLYSQGGPCTDLGVNPSAAETLTFDLLGTRSIGGTGNWGLGACDCRWAASRSGGAPTLGQGSAGICASSGFAWVATAPGSSTYGPGGTCDFLCANVTGVVCTAVWGRWRVAVTINAGGAGNFVSWRYRIRVASAWSISLRESVS